MLEPNVDYKFRTPIPVKAMTETDQLPETSAHVILYEGEFNHGGDILILTKEDLESMVMNYEANVLGTDPPIDFSHNDESLAAGWIIGLHKTEITLNDEQRSALLATIKWTKAGREALTNKEFRYFSASFSMILSDGSTGQAFGPTLRGGALTNIPFLKQLDPIVELSRKTASSKTLKKEKRKMSTIELSEHKAQLKVFEDRVKELESTNKELSVKAEKFADAETKIVELKTELANVRKEIQNKEREAKFEKMLSEGKAVQAQREAFLSDDMDAFIELAQPVNLTSTGNAEEETSGEKMSAADKKMFDKFLKNHMTEEEFLKAQSAQKQ